jgi:TetR/AcrR family transcriptional regulator, repressor for uid operon
MPKIAEEARAARRDQIIAAGLACFARSGYHATTMADVAAQAGVSKGTPYLYFDSKQSLFLALHEQWDCGAGQRVDAAIAALPHEQRQSPHAVLRAVAAAIATHVQAEAETCRVLMEARALAAHVPVIAAAVRAADQQMHRQLEGLFAAGVAAGEWPAGTDPGLAARLFAAGLYGLMAQWHLAPGSFSWPQAAAALAASPAPVASGTEPARKPGSPNPGFGPSPPPRRPFRSPSK